jgi:glycosyltransferase involved in cell wall biosynthesis
MSQSRPSTPSPDADGTLRVVLWYRRGAGLHFSGPGRTAYRMYAKAQQGRFRLTLVHGFPEHAAYDLFEQQFCLGHCGTGLVSQMRFIERGKRWLARHAREHDMFHGLSGYLVTLAPALYAQRLGLPAVVKLIAWRADMADKQRWKTWLGISQRRRDRLRQLDAVIAIAPAIYDELVEYGVAPERIARIPNGVDVQWYRPSADRQEQRSLRQQLGWRDVPTLLFAGGINRRKQPQLLIEALARLPASQSDCQLMLAGPVDDPPLAAAMRQRASELGVSPRVHWLGVCQDMAPLYRAADLFCLPSQLEGLPNAVLEAMASGIPSLVTPIPGCLDLVDDGQSGRIVGANGDELAAAIAGYFQTPELLRQHGQAARRKAEAQFDVRRVLDAHERLFHAVRRGQAPARASLF